MVEKLVDQSKIILRLSDLTSEPKRMLPTIKGYENQPVLSPEKAIEPLISLVPDIKQNCENPADDLTPDGSDSIMLYELEWEPPEFSFYFVLNSTLRSQKLTRIKVMISIASIN